MKKIIIIAIFLLGISSIYGKDFNIGVIGDSRDEYLQEKKLIDKELQDNFYNSGFDPKVVEEAFVDDSNNLEDEINRLEIKRVDAILLVGNRVAEEALSIKTYTTPTVVINGVLEPNDNKNNLNYLYMDDIVKNDLKILKKIRQVKKIAIYAPNNKDNKSIKRALGESGVEGVFVDKDDLNLKEEIASSDALYILHNDKEAILKLLGVAREEKVFSISRVSNDKKVNDETMIYFNSNDEAKKRVRVAAVNLSDIARGEDMSFLTSKVNLDNLETYFNYNLAQELGVFPKIEYLQAITLTGVESSSRSNLNFVDGANLAIDKNTSIKSSMSDLEASKYDITTAKADRRPELSAYSEYKKQDSDTSKAEWTGPENSLRGGLSLKYTLFDDEVNSNVKVSELRNEANKYRYNQERLDTIKSYSNIYLNILSLDSELNIEKTNYALLNKYLKIAETKYRVGSEGPQDIYRFQSELSKSLGNISEIRGNIKSSESDLNRVLNAPMTNLYNLGGVEDTDSSFLIVSTIIKSIYGDNKKNEKLRNYLMKIGMKDSPELKQLDSEIAATERKYLAAKRLRYMPKVTANGDISDDLKDPWGEGAEDKQDTWTAGVKVELPLIKGGSIESNKRSLNKQLESLKYQRETLEDEISQKILSSLNNVEKYYIQTVTSKENMVSAKKNLDLVEDLYIEGTISISDLLDARTDYINAVSDNSATTYLYLNSIIDLQRAIGRNYVTMSNLEVQEEMDKIKNILK